MAYKFQRGTAILSGTLDQQGDILVLDGSAGTDPATTKIKLLSQTGDISGSGLIHVVGAATFGNSLATTGSITAGTALAASGLANLNGGIEVDNGGNKFTVSTAGVVSASGDVQSLGDIVLGGTKRLDADGSATLLATTTTTLGATGLASLDGGINVDDNFTVSAAGAIAVDTDKFTVSAAGIVKAVGAISGGSTLHAVGATTLGATLATTGSITAKNGFIASQPTNSLHVISGSGAAAFSGSLDVAHGKFSIDTDGQIDLCPSASITDLFVGDDLDVAGQLNLVGALNVGGAAHLDGTLKLDGVAEATVQKGENQDALYFKDNTDNLVKSIDIFDFVSGLAGAGLSAADGVLSADAGGTPSILVDGTTLSEGTNFATGTSGGTVFLPSPGDAVAANRPSQGDTFRVKMNEIGEVTIKVSGSADIDDNAQIKLESPFASVTLVFVSGSDFGNRYAIV